MINGLGLAMIHRIDLALGDRAAQLGNDYSPAAPAAADLDCRRRGPVRRRARRGARPPHPAALHLHRDARRSRAAAPAAAAGHRHHDQRRAHLDPPRRLLVPARRAGQARPARVLRGLPRDQARRARPGQPPGGRHRPAARPRPRADHRCLGGEPCRARSSSATSARRCSSSAPSSPCSTSRPSGSPGCSSVSSLFLSGSFVAWTLFGHVKQRVDIWLDPTLTTTMRSAAAIS